jgi:hypothetical protein
VVILGSDGVDVWGSRRVDESIDNSAGGGTAADIDTSHGCEGLWVHVHRQSGEMISQISRVSEDGACLKDEKAVDHLAIKEIPMDVAHKLL